MTPPAEGLDNILVVDGVPATAKSKLEKLLQKLWKETYRTFLHFCSLNPKCATDGHVVVKSSGLRFSHSVGIVRWGNGMVRKRSEGWC